MASTTRTIDTAAGQGMVELTGEPARGLALLTHGAAGGVHSPDLVAVRDVLVAAGFGVGLVIQPFRVAGRRVPPKPDAQDAAWCSIVTQVRVPGVPLLLGGRSNGARVACRTALEAGAAGVLALAFPLHPPGRPDKSRLDELDGSGVPTLVVQGERDPFGMPLPGIDRQVVVVPGDHALKRDPAAVAAAVESFAATFGPVA